jgi:hypothetical protein
MSTTQFIDELAAGNASGAKDILNDMLSARAFEALEGRKVEIAQNIFNGSQVQEEEVEITQEEFDQLDEISKKTATSAYVSRMGREDDKSPDKAVKTMDRIYKKHGATGVMRAATAADKKYGIHSADYTKKDFVGDYLSGQRKK